MKNLIRALAGVAAWLRLAPSCICVLFFSAGSMTAYADVTPTGTVTATDIVGSGGSNPVTATAGNLTFGPEIEITLDTGQLLVDLGSVLTAGTIVPLDTGAVTVTGVGSRINLIGNGNRLDIQGPASSFQILAGGVIDATGGICVPGVCNNFLGNFPGAEASLVVDGLGSQLNTINGLVIAAGNTDFGVVGANSTAQVDVLNGGAINSVNTFISNGLSGGNIQAGQSTSALVTVSGVGSQWNATNLDIASGLNATAQVNVFSGGIITTEFLFTVQNATGNADLVVDGAGSLVVVNNAMVLGALGSSTVNVSNGGILAVANDLALGGGNGASGNLFVDEIGSQLITGTMSVAAAGGSSGGFVISAGATATISGNGGTGFLGVGDGLNSNGSLTVTGTGSNLNVFGTSGLLAIGNDFNDLAGTGNGTMFLQDNATVQILGSDPGTSNVLIGYGRNGFLFADTGGSLTVDGAFFVGTGATGNATFVGGSQLLVTDVTGVALNNEVGIEIGASRFDNLDSFGELNIQGVGTSAIVRSNSAGTEAYIDIGIANTDFTGSGVGNGILRVNDGASLLVDGGLDFGFIGAGAGANASGVLDISDVGTSVVVTGVSGVVLAASDVDGAIGSGTGNVLVFDGASLDIFGTDPGTSFFGIGVGLGNGFGLVATGATLDVDGDIFVAGVSPFTGNSAGSGLLQIFDNSVVTALRITVGANGSITGDGVLVSNSLSVEAGGLVLLDNLANVQDISVDGPGSQINLSGDLLIGQLGTATLFASNGGQVSSGSLSIGTGVGTMGTVSVDGFDTVLFSGFSGVGGATAVGAADGANGALNVTNGARVFLGNLSGPAFLNVAGAPGSTGNVSVASGGQLEVAGNTSGLLAIGSDLNSAAGAGTGSLTISDSGFVTVFGTVTPGESEVLVGSGGDGALQIDTDGLLSLDGFLSIGEGGTGTVDVSGGSTLLLADFFGAGVDVADIGIEIGLSREGDNLDGTGTLTVSGPGSSVSVQGADAYIDIAVANTAETGTGNASGQLNVTNEATLLVQAEPGEIGAILVGVGGTSSAEFNITGPGSTALITGGRGVLLVASDIDQAVGAAQGSLLVDAGATLNIFGSNPGTSVLAIGMGLGDGTGVVSGGSTVNVDGDLFVSASNATVLNLFPEIDDEPLSGNDAQTGFLTINDTASVIANFTTIGNRGTLAGTGFLASDTFIETGGSLELSGTIIGNVLNFGGTVDPGGAGVVGGTLSITGNYSQEAGLLRFSLAGNQPGQFDQLDVSGDIDIFGGAIEVELVNGATTAATNGVPLMLARGALTINEAVAFNVGAGQPSFELVPSEAFFVDPSTGSQVATQIASLNFLEQNLVDVVELASLPPNQASLAASFDDTCGNLTGVSDLTPEEQDLLAVCTDVRNAGNTPEQIAQALDALGTDEVTQTTNSTLLFTIPQHGNLSQRVNSIHSGSNPVDFSGLNLRFEEHQIAGADLERFVKGLLGIGAGDADEFSKWGVFGNGNINFGDKNATDNGNGFDYETITMTIGADYRARDNLVFGGTLSYSDVNADFDEGGGMDLTSWAFSGFGTYFLKDKFYLDLLATYGENEIDVSRHIVYDTVLGGTVRKAKSNTDGDQVSFSFGTGYDFTPGAWVFGPHAGANYTDLETDSYTEQGAGGLNLTIDRQTATSFTANLGFHVAYTYTPEWGVITPYLRADYVREFKDDAEIIEVSFAADRFVNDPLNPSEPIRLSTDERDKEYFVYSVGVSIQLIRGIAGFLNYRTAQNIENLSLTDITWGIRLETEW